MSSLPLPSHPNVTACKHCGATLREGGKGHEFCSESCASVFDRLQRAGLGRYYDLRGEALGQRSPDQERPRDHKWLELQAALIQRQSQAICTVDVQGLHCVGCVWLLEELFRREGEAAHGLLLNPTTGRATLTVGPSFDLLHYAKELETFGYALGPAKRDTKTKSDLLWRMGVAIAISMNTMIFGIATYAGLESGPVYRLFQSLTFALTTLSVWVGGSVFIRSAWHAARRGILHLDLPIALGVVLAYVSSAYTYFVVGSSRTFFDTINVFIALMLVGRFLQERMVDRNRAMVLADDGVDGILVRRATADAKKVELAPARDLKVGDELWVARGDLVPVASTLLSESPATFTLEWISGESRPLAVLPGGTVPAGAFYTDSTPVNVRATTTFADSALVDLLRRPELGAREEGQATSFWRNLSLIYVVSVLAVAALTFGAWLYVSGDFRRSVEVVTAVLIVTCPCAFGIATPLATELVLGGLRRAGLFVRTRGFLDRAVEVNEIIFDKTGTLTTGQLELREPLPPLSESDLEALYAMVARSNHPKSVAVLAALHRAGRGAMPAWTRDADLCERTGKGLELRARGAVYRLGSASFAAGGSMQADLVFSRDGELLFAAHTHEVLRPNARLEIQALQAEGLGVTILSGDRADRVSALATSSGVRSEQAIAEASPEDKRAFIGRHARALFIGDGLNDGLAGESAFLTGTPAIERPFMAARSDFFFTTAGLEPIRLGLRAARQLRATVRGNLLIAVAYNVVTITLSAMGLMSPLLCAVLMPLSSLSTILHSTRTVGRSARLWKY